MGKKSSLPPTWTTNWVHNCELVLGWTDAVAKFTKIDATDHTQYVARRAMRIENSEMRQVVCKHGAYFADMLDWIHLLVNHNADHWCPRCTLSEVDLSAYRALGQARHERGADDTPHRCALPSTTSPPSARKLAAFRAEDAGEYSSYSDYWRGHGQRRRGRL